MSNTVESSAQVLKPAQPSNQDPSPFLNLPAELRNQIYDYVFTEQAYTFRAGLSAERGCILRPNFPTPGWVGLAAACRQIHAETALLPFEYGIFYVDAAVQLTLLLDRFKHLPQAETIIRLRESRYDHPAMEPDQIGYYTFGRYAPSVRTVQVKMVDRKWAGEYYQMKGWGDLPEFPETGPREALVADGQDGIKVVFLPLRGI